MYRFFPEAAASLLHGKAKASAQTQVCMAAGCGAAMQQRWWRRPGVRINEQPYCSPHCLASFFSGMTASVSQRIAREPHRHRVPLGLLMLSQGWITSAQLQHALRVQKESRIEGGEQRIGYYLDREGIVNEDLITRALGLQWNCPVFDFRAAGSAFVTGHVPLELARCYSFVPLRIGVSGELFVAFDSGLDSEAVFAMQQMCGMPVVAGLLPRSAFHRAMAAMAGAPDPGTDVLRGAVANDGAAQGMAQWVFDTAAAQDPQAVHVFRCLQLHNHLWVRSTAGSSLLVPILRERDADS